MLQLTLKPSAIQLSLVMIFHGVTWLVLMSLPMAPRLSGLISLTLLVSLFYQGRGLLLFSQHSLIRVLISHERCVLTFKTYRCKCVLPRVKYFSEYLCVLQFQCLLKPKLVSHRLYDSERHKSSVNLILCPDSIGREQFRLLRKYLLAANLKHSS